MIQTTNRRCRNRFAPLPIPGVPGRGDQTWARGGCRVDARTAAVVRCEKRLALLRCRRRFAEAAFAVDDQAVRAVVQAAARDRDRARVFDLLAQVLRGPG